MMRRGERSERGAMRDQGPTGRGGRNRRDNNGRVRHRTGDSSSPSESVSSDEEAFDKRKSKRMRIEMERMRPMNMSKHDMNKVKQKLKGDPKNVTLTIVGYEIKQEYFYFYPMKVIYVFLKN